MRKLLILAGFLVGVLHAAPALVDSTLHFGSGTSASLNCSGANFVAVIGDFLHTTATAPTDSLSDTYHGLTVYNGGNNDDLVVYYAYNVSGTNGMTVTGGGGGFNRGFIAACFSGVQSTSDPFQAGTDKGFHSASTSIQPGSSTPASNSLVVTGFDNFDNTGSLTMSVTDSNLTYSKNQSGSNGSIGYLSMAWAVDAGGVSTNPQWSTSGASANQVANSAAFSGSGGAAAPPHGLPTLGAGHADID